MASGWSTKVVTGLRKLFFNSWFTSQLGWGHTQPWLSLVFQIEF